MTEEKTITLSDELLTLPEDIRSVEKKLMAHALKKCDLKSAMDNWENKVMLQISLTLTDEEQPKKKFTNDQSRKAELNRLKSHDETYREIQRQYHKRDVEDKEDQIEHNFLINKFRALRKVADLMVAKKQ